MNHETEVILGQANMNFIQGQTGPAKEGFLEVIRQDPYVHSAWVALASCYDMEGDVETARQMRFFGAHIEGDADAWKELAKEFRWVMRTSPSGEENTPYPKTSITFRRSGGFGSLETALIRVGNKDKTHRRFTATARL
jgi:hypothetical protein